MVSSFLVRVLHLDIVLRRIANHAYVRFRSRSTSSPSTRCNLLFMVWWHEFCRLSCGKILHYSTGYAFEKESYPAAGASWYCWADMESAQCYCYWFASECLDCRMDPAALVVGRVSLWIPGTNDD